MKFIKRLICKFIGHRRPYRKFRGIATNTVIYFGPCERCSEDGAEAYSEYS